MQSKRRYVFYPVLFYGFGDLETTLGSTPFRGNALLSHYLKHSLPMLS